MKSRALAIVAIGVCVIANGRLLLSPLGSTADGTAPWAFAACAGVLVLVLVKPPPSARWSRAILITGLALLMAAVTVAPRQSNDVWAYAMYGRIAAVHHHSPYVFEPAAFPHDPALARTGWQHTRSVYGPAFTGVSMVIARIVGNSALATRVAYQGLAAVSIGAVLVMLHRRRRTRVLAAVALHPIVVVSIVNGGHADAIVGGLLVATAMLAARQRWAWTGVVGALALLVKADAIVPLVGIGAWCLFRYGIRRAAIVGGIAGAVTVAAYALAGGLTALRPLLDVAGRTSRASTWHVLADGAHGTTIRFGVLVALVAIPALMLAGSRIERGPAVVAGATGLAFILGAPYVLTWYFALALPLVVSDAAESLLGVVLLLDSMLVAVAYQYHRVVTRDLLDQLLHGSIRLTQLLQVLAIIVLLAVATYRIARRLAKKPELIGA